MPSFWTSSQRHADNKDQSSSSSASYKYFMEDQDSCYDYGDQSYYPYHVDYRSVLDGADSEEDALVREALSAIAQTVRVEIESEVVNWAQDARHFLQRRFPLIVRYQEEPAQLKQDAEHLALYFVLLVVAVWFLGRPPLSTRYSYYSRGRSGSNKKKQHLELLNRRFYLKRSVSSGRVAPDDEPNVDPWGLFSADRQLLLQRQDSSAASTTDQTTDDEEERFEQYYSEVICRSRYRRLVLPPQCRYVGNNTTTTTTTTTRAAATANTKQTTSTDKKDTQTDKNTTIDEDDEDDEDNPVGRIQYYMQQLWSLIRSILSFDYTGAVWTVWVWAQNVRRRHSQPPTDSDEEVQVDLDMKDEAVRESPVHLEATTAPAEAEEEEHEKDVDERDETLSTLDEEDNDKLSSVEEEDENADNDIGNRIRYPSPLHMMTDHGRNNEDEDGNNLDDFASPRKEQTTPVRVQDPNSSSSSQRHPSLRSEVPQLPLITPKELLRHGMLQQEHSKGENQEEETTPPKAEQGNIGDSSASSSKRFIAKVLPSRSWLRKRNSVGNSNTELLATEAESNTAELSEVDTGHEDTASDGLVSPPCSPLRSPRLESDQNWESSSISPRIHHDQTLLQQDPSSSMLLPRDDQDGCSDPLLLSTTMDRSDEQQPTLLDDRGTLTSLASEQEKRYPLRRGLFQTPAPLQDTAAKTTTNATTSSKSSLRHFFDTASTRESLKKMSVEVGIPDKHGYIMGDDFLPDGDRSSPLLVFVNSRSGPQQGHLLVAQLRRLLNPIQVCDLSMDNPETKLESFLVLSNLRILVCGGDGTVSWIIHVLEQMKLPPKQWPPIAILPLGTGNDLARIHGWGGGYNNSESLITILERIAESYASLLDRWEVTVHDRRNKNNKHDEIKSCINYLGIGADAAAALQVHYLRESRPQWFFSRVLNKAMYGIFGAEDILRASSVHVRKEITLVADGVEVPLPPDSQGIILLNIDSYAGGVPLWTHGVKIQHQQSPFPPSTANPGPRRTRSLSDFEVQNSNAMDRVDSTENLLRDLMTAEEKFARVTACDLPSSCMDGYLDVVSIRGAFHLGQIKVGLGNAQRLCQCREATITIRNKAAVQIDGEPWRQRAATLTIRRKKDPAVMLHRSQDDGGVEMEMSKLLDWAEERNMIDSKVHTILMKEFSRRIESKTRQRRVRAQDNIMTTLKKAISSGALASNSISGSSSTMMWQGGGGDGILF